MAVRQPVFGGIEFAINLSGGFCVNRITYDKGWRRLEDAVWAVLRRVTAGDGADDDGTDDDHLHRHEVIPSRFQRHVATFVDAEDAGFFTAQTQRDKPIGRKESDRADDSPRFAVLAVGVLQLNHEIVRIVHGLGDEVFHDFPRVILAKCSRRRSTRRLALTLEPLSVSAAHFQRSSTMALTRLVNSQKIFGKS